MAKKEILEKYRNHWKKIPREREDYRTLFSIAQGILERTGDSSHGLLQGVYFRTVLERFEETLSQPPQPTNVIEQLGKLIAPARQLSLPVKTPNIDLISKVEGTFGVIQSIEEGVADISMYIKAGEKDHTKPLLEGIQVPLDKIVEAYRVPGAGLCLVEYNFKDGRPSEGNFEPASSLL